MIQHLIYWYANLDQGEEEINRILLDILNTDISPELVPGTDQKGQPIQRTEDFIGPYELQDFNLYYLTQLGYRPGKVFSLSCLAGQNCGPFHTPRKHAYRITFSEIKQAASFRGVFTETASLNAPPCRTGRKWDPAVPFLPGAAGALLLTL